MNNVEKAMKSRVLLGVRFDYPCQSEHFHFSAGLARNCDVVNGKITEDESLKMREQNLPRPLA